MQMMGQESGRPAGQHNCSLLLVLLVLHSGGNEDAQARQPALLRLLRWHLSMQQTRQPGTASQTPWTSDISWKGGRQAGRQSSPHLAQHLDHGGEGEPLGDGLACSTCWLGRGQKGPLRLHATATRCLGHTQSEGG